MDDVVIVNIVVSSVIYGLVLVGSAVGMITGTWKYRAWKSRPIVVGEFVERKRGSSMVTWTHFGQAYVGVVKHPLLFLALSDKAHLRGIRSGSKVVPDYWFCNGLGLSVVSAVGLFVSGFMIGTMWFW